MTSVARMDDMSGHLHVNRIECIILLIREHHIPRQSWTRRKASDGKQMPEQSPKDKKAKELSLAYQIWSLRKKRHLGQKKLAELAGVSVSTVKNAENGKHRPYSYTLSALIDVLNPSAEEHEQLWQAWRLEDLHEKLVGLAGELTEDYPGLQSVTAPETPPTPAGSATSTERQAPVSGWRVVWVSWIRYQKYNKLFRRLLALLLALLLLALLVTSTIFPFIAQRKSIPLPDVHIPGWFFAVQWRGGEPRIIVTINATTGAWRSLWPPANSLLVNGPHINTADFDWLKSPAVNLHSHSLAFISWK